MSYPGATACPKCGVECPCVDWSEVDIGVGIQVFDQQYRCPEHGLFAFGEEGPVFQDDEAHVFADPDVAAAHNVGDCVPGCPYCAWRDLAKGAW